MEIVWLGHASVILKGVDVSLITDPFPASLGIAMAQEKADIVTVSNSHPNHSNVEDVGGDPRVIDGPGEYEIGGYYISGTATAPRGDGPGSSTVNTIFTIRAEGVTVCHLGDLSQPLTPGQTQQLNDTDVLIVPVGGGCTIEPSAAADLVNAISPRIVIPIHYRTDGVSVDLQPVDAFLGQIGVSQVAPQSRLNVSAINLPKEQRVAVLQRAV